MLSLRLSFLLIMLFLHFSVAVKGSDKYSRKDFPPGFVFGSGTSAYQVEGAANDEGRTPSTWDTFAHAGKVPGGATGDIACDGYHKYKEDVQLMVETGLDAYRFSISWSRLIPDGRGPVNPKGLQYYNNLIDELIRHGIQPHVTLFHTDHPQALEDEYGGWLSQKIVEDFTAFADVSFKEFGDRVSYWTTMNEPNALAIGGYDMGFLPPGRCSAPFGFINCFIGNSSSEPYIAVHHMLLAHASAVSLYRKKYQGKQNGFIGLSIYSPGFVPMTNSTEDAVASQRARDFIVGWIAHPLVFGDYPDIMKKNAGSRLPAFSNQESKLVMSSFDFIGVLHYYVFYVEDNSGNLKSDKRDFNADMAVGLTWNYSFSTQEFPILPWGMQRVLEYFKEVYHNPVVYIYENGQQTRRNSSLEDITRVEYMHAYIGSLLDALRNGSNARGYFTWSFLDLLELIGGYESSYGLYYVDLSDPDLKRYPKLSAKCNVIIRTNEYSLLEDPATDWNISYEVISFNSTD